MEEISEPGNKGAAQRMPTAKRFPSETTTVDFDEPGSLVGRRLDGRFFIVKNLTDGGADTGGIGVVYLAEDTKLLGKEVVVKILNETALKHPDIVRKFEHEKEALIRLDHPGIVRILDSGTLRDGNPFMVMDFIKGHSLRKAIQLAGRLPLEMVASVVEAVTDALTAAHSSKILHRDIKPENIMLTPIEEGLYRVRLIDFGIARVEESRLAPETEICRAIGSVHYISPEQLIGRLDLTPAADIFSMAIVAYEMLTGELPFKPKTLAEMYPLELAGVKTPPSSLRADMPREAERILLEALVFEAEKRPQNARAWGRYLARELRSDGHETDRFYASVKTEFHQSPTQHIPVPDPADFETVQRVPANPLADKVISASKWMVPVAFVLALAAITGAYFVWDTSQPQSQAAIPTAAVPAETGPDHQIPYFLTVQKMRNGKPFEAPFRSSGQDTVEKDYRVGMTFVPDADGYMYLFNHGQDAAGRLVFKTLFPTPKQNDGASRVRAGQLAATSSNTVEGTRGTEVMWLIWTKDQNSDLESVLKSAFETGGDLNAESEQKLRNFLEKSRPSKPEAVKDTADQQTIIKAKGDEVVYRFELEHR